MYTNKKMVNFVITRYIEPCERTAYSQLCVGNFDSSSTRLVRGAGILGSRAFSALVKESGGRTFRVHRREDLPRPGQKLLEAPCGLLVW